MLKEWKAFAESHPEAHLAIGLFDVGDRLPAAPHGEKPVSRYSVLRNFVQTFEPTGAWAIRLERPLHGEPMMCEAWVAFERAADADWLAESLPTRPATRLRGFASQREFTYGVAVYQKLLMALTGHLRPSGLPTLPAGTLNSFTPAQ